MSVDSSEPLSEIVWLPGSEILQKAFCQIDADIEKTMTPPPWVERLDPAERQAWWYEQWQATLHLRQMRQRILFTATTFNYRLPRPGEGLRENGLLPGPLIEPPISGN